MRVLVFLSLFVLSSNLWAAPAHQARIIELKRLRDSLPLKDSKRAVLNWNIALLMTEQANQSKGDGSLDNTRTAALFLFEYLLRGDQFQRPVEGEKFYLAHLHSGLLAMDLKQFSKAVTFLETAQGQTLYPELKRKAAIRLAEHFDGQNDYSKAHHYYSAALEQCVGEDICSYLHFRNAWVFHKEKKYGPAVVTMRRALWQSNGQVREEALRDLLVFHAFNRTKNKIAINEINDLSEKTKNPKLLGEYAEVLFSQGLNKEGVEVLGYAQARHPSLSNQIRLITAHYGQRNWSKFKKAIGDLFAFSNSATDAEESEPARRQLRNLAVQLDGERQSDPSRATEFALVAELYLHLFPESEDRSQIMEGWLAAESNETRKLARLSEWFQRNLISPETANFKEFHEQRAQLAAKLGQPLVAIESLDLVLDSNPSNDADRWKLVMKAEMLEKLNRHEDALSVYRALANAKGVPDEITWQSRKALIDTLQQRKDFPTLISLMEGWLKNRTRTMASDIDVKWETLERTYRDSRFEYAKSLGYTKDSLDIMSDLCQRRELMPHSCQNAVSIAELLHDPKKYVLAKEVIASPEELATAYETAGAFAQAAEQYEKLWKKQVSSEQMLKVAMLYELGGRGSDQMRILKKLKDCLSEFRSMGTMEGLILESFKDAGLLDTKMLNLPWSDSNRVRLAVYIEQSGKSTATTKSLVRQAGPQVAGVAWRKSVLAQLDFQVEKQRSIDFRGKDSERQFKRRMSHLEWVTSIADKYLAVADKETAQQIRIRLIGLYRELGHNIRQTPIPKGISATQRAQVTQKLEELAQPLEKRAAYYESRSNEGLDITLEDYSKGRTSPTARPGYQQFVRNPWNEDAVAELKETLEEAGEMRLSAYFEGRLKRLRKGDDV